MRKPIVCIGLAVATGLISPPAAEAGPAAMVEDVSGTVPGIQPLDYLAAGKVIHLAASDRLILDYFQSCIRETIVAGVVTIGTDQSSVQGGTIARDKITCDAGDLELSPAQNAASSVVVFRDSSLSSGKKLPAPQRTLYGTTPLIELPGGGYLHRKARAR